MTQDYEMLYLQDREKYYLELLENQRRYEVYELPFIIQTILKQISEVCLEKRKVFDLRTEANDDNSSHPTEEIF